MKKHVLELDRNRRNMSKMWRMAFEGFSNRNVKLFTRHNPSNSMWYKPSTAKKHLVKLGRLKWIQKKTTRKVNYLQKVAGNHVKATFRFGFGWTNIRELNRHHLVFAWEIVDILMYLMIKHDVNWLQGVWDNNKIKIYLMKHGRGL